VSTNYKYCSLDIAGQRLDYCYNPINGDVSTQHFPGIPIHRVALGCGMYATHDDIRKIIEYKLEIPCKHIHEDLF